MPRVNFTYDPHVIIRHILEIHVERNVQGKFPKSIVWASYKYLQGLQEDRLKEIIAEFAKREGIDTITLKDSEGDSRKMFEIIKEDKVYKDLVAGYEDMGANETGYGVRDLTSGIFYECKYLQHWETVKSAIKSHYSVMWDALRMMEYDNDVHEHNGTTRDELESFIMDNFKLIGATKPVVEYMA